MSTHDNGAIETPDWDIARVLRARIEADTGVRYDLDEVIRAFGMDPDELRDQTADETAYLMASPANAEALRTAVARERRFFHSPPCPHERCFVCEPTKAPGHTRCRCP